MKKHIMTTREAAKYLGISPYYLRNMRQQQHNHDGPEHFIAQHIRGKAYFYTVESLDRWNLQHKWRRKK